MERGNSRKITIAVLAIISIGLAAGAIYIGALLQQNQAPDDSGAFGFGDNAVKDYFDELDGFFKTVPCGLMLNNGFVIALSNGYGKPLLDYRLSLFQEEDVTDFLFRRCGYTEDTLVAGDASKPIKTYFTVDLVTYNTQSYIYKSEIEKISTLNSTFIAGQPLDQGTFADYKTKYAYGVSKFNSSLCVGLIYHDTNEFEYVLFTYTGYNCTSTDTIYKNKVYATALSSFVDKSIDSIYGAAGFNPIDYKP